MTSVETSEEVADQPTYSARVRAAYDRPIGLWRRVGRSVIEIWKELEEEWLSSETREHYARRGPVRWVDSVRVPGWRAAFRS
jgi:hypothetical protein